MKNNQLLEELLSELQISNKELRDSRDSYQKQCVRLQYEKEKLQQDFETLKSDESSLEYKLLFNQVHLPFIVFKLIYDDQNKPHDFQYKDMNQAYLDWVGLTKTELIGKEAHTVFDDYRTESDWFPRMIEVATTGQPQLTKQASSLYDKWLHISMHSPGKDEVAMLVMDITKEKEAENKSRLSDTRLNLALEMENIALWEWVIPLDRVENYNEYWKELYHFENKDTSKQFYDRIFEEDAEPAQKSLEAHLAGKTENFHQIYRLRNCNDDGFKWIRNTGKVIEEDAKGNPIRIVGVSTDITEQREKEIRLERWAFEQKYAQELSKMGNWYYNAISGKVEWTEQVYKIFGLDPTLPAVPYVDQQKFYTSSSWKLLTNAAEKALNEGISYDLELEVIPLDQKKSRWLRSIGVPVLGKDHKVIGLRGVAQDISEDKEREERLKRTSIELNRAQSLSKIGSWYLDVVTNEVTWTNEIYRMYGFDPAYPPPPYTEHMKLFTTESWVRLSTELNKTATQGIPYDLELEMAADQATFGWMRAMGEAVYDDHGKIIGLRGTAQDITELKEINDKLEKEKRFAETIMESSAAGTYIFDVQHRKNIYANKRTGEVLGYVPEELKEMTSEQFMSRFHEEDLPTIFQHYEVVNTQLKASKIKYRFKHKKGHWVTCIGVDAPYEYDESGNLKSYISSFIDISELQQKEEELIQARNEAIAANKQKDLFLSNLSHEIRTPMNGVIGFSKMLKDDDLTVNQKNRYIEQISWNSNQLMTIIDDILMLSKLDSEQFTLNKEPVDLNQLLSNLVENHQKIIEESPEKKALKLIFLEDRPEQKHVTLLTDAVRLSQVINNLVTNAIKFSKKGTIEIGFDLLTAKKKIKICVKDQGIGIPKKKQKKIFDRFSQVNEDLSTQMGGIGLGLAICQNIVQALGGEIKVASRYRKGSTFSIILPFDGAYTTLEPKTRKVKKLIIADDSASIQLFYKSLLNRTGITLLSAYNGKEVIELCHKYEDVDLILMDMRMPGMDGPTALKELRKFNKGVRVVAQTAFAMESQIVEFKKLGFEDFLTKPIDEDKLFDLLVNSST